MKTCCVLLAPDGDASGHKVYPGSGKRRPYVQRGGGFLYCFAPKCLYRGGYKRMRLQCGERTRARCTRSSLRGGCLSGCLAIDPRQQQSGRQVAAIIVCSRPSSPIRQSGGQFQYFADIFLRHRLGYHTLRITGCPCCPSKQCLGATSPDRLGELGPYVSEQLVQASTLFSFEVFFLWRPFDRSISLWKVNNAYIAL